MACKRKKKKIFFFDLYIWKWIEHLITWKLWEESTNLLKERKKDRKRKKERKKEGKKAKIFFSISFFFYMYMWKWTDHLFT